MYFAKYEFRFFLSWLIAIKIAVLSTFVANFTMSQLHVLSGKFLHGKSCCPKSFRFFWLWAFIIDAINQFRTEVIIHQRRQQIKTLPSALTKKKTFCRSNHNYRFLHKSWSKFSIKISAKLHHQNFDWLQLKKHDKLDQVNSANFLFELWSLVFYVLIFHRICRAEQLLRGTLLRRILLRGTLIYGGTGSI